VTFATPLGLLALLAIPTIVAIHLLRRRFPPRPVAGLFLWQTIKQAPAEGRKVGPLPISTSLILECLAALALALILAGARLDSADVSRHLVVLLDDSASMAAATPAGDSARDRAVRRVIQEIEGLGRSARVSIVLSGDRPAVLAGPAAYAMEARSALEAWTPEASAHSLALGLRLARELAGETGSLMIVSDQTPDVRGQDDVARALWVAVGQPLANVGITSAERSLVPDEGRGAITLTLANNTSAPAKRQVSLTAGGKPIATRELEVPPGASSVNLPIPPGLPSVVVTLDTDALARDNAVALAEPRPRIVGVENRLAEGRGREALEKALGAVTGVTPATTAHLVFADATEIDGQVQPGSWRVLFGAPPERWRAAGDAADFAGPFILEKRNPMLLGVTLGGVVWTGAAPLSRGAVHPLASAGDQVLIGVPTADASRAESTFFLNLDLQRTNLIRAPDWPILVSNLIEMRRKSLPGPERWNYRVGEWVRVRLPRDPEAPVRIRGIGPERTLPLGRVVEFVAPSPGGLLQIVEGDRVLYELGVNFLDETESDLRRQASAESGDRGGADVRAESGPASDPLFWILLALAGAAVLTNWTLLFRVRASV
jgi:hypothetical protein